MGKKGSRIKELERLCALKKEQIARLEARYHQTLARERAADIKLSDERKESDRRERALLAAGFVDIKAQASSAVFVNDCGHKTLELEIPLSALSKTEIEELEALLLPKRGPNYKPVRAEDIASHTITNGSIKGGSFNPDKIIGGSTTIGSVDFQTAMNKIRKRADEAAGRYCIPRTAAAGCAR